jgi:hypothetical protein
MALIESSVFFGPAVMTPTGAEQSGIITDDNGFVDRPLFDRQRTGADIGHNPSPSNRKSGRA